MAPLGAGGLGAFVVVFEVAELFGGFAEDEEEDAGDDEEVGASDVDEGESCLRKWRHERGPHFRCTAL